MGNRRQSRQSRHERGAHAREVGEGARTVRLQQLIREELNLLLRSEVRDPRLAAVEVTMVELSTDGSRARAWFTAPDGNEAETLEALDGAAGFLRTELAESLGLKRTPDLRFRRDPATRVFAAATGGT